MNYKKKFNDLFYKILSLFDSRPLEVVNNTKFTSIGLKNNKPVKECLECGKTHTHSNSWCSTKCCRKYRSKE